MFNIVTNVRGESFIEGPYNTRMKLDGIMFEQTTMDSNGMTMEYSVVGVGADKSVETLKEVFPNINFVDPKRERIEAHRRFIKSIEDRAIERFKRENGL